MSVHRQHTFSSPMADSATVSPEPGSFPKRRPAAVSRLAVPNEAGDAQQPCTGGIPSCRSDAAERGSSWPRVPTPPLSAGSHWRAPRLSKPGYQLDPVVYHKVWSIFCLLLLVAVASVSTHRQRQLAAVLSSVQQKHRVRVFELGGECWVLGTAWCMAACCADMLSLTESCWLVV